jgi:hypothetical protein
MSAHIQAASVTGKRLWAGRILSGFAVLFLLFDGVTKVLKSAAVLEASARLGYPEGVIPGIGLLLLACTLAYVIPRTAILGAILLTGFLGGAVATHVRVGAPLFPVAFSVAFGVLIWAGLFLRRSEVRALLP